MEILNKDNKLIQVELFNLEDRLEQNNRKTERGELLRFFVENIKTKKGGKYGFPFIAMKLSHLSVQDLYYLVSACKDRLSREGQESMQKYFWWSIK